MVTLNFTTAIREMVEHPASVWIGQSDHFVREFSVNEFGDLMERPVGNGEFNRSCTPACQLMELKFHRKDPLPAEQTKPTPRSYSRFQADQSMRANHGELWVPRGNEFTEERPHGDTFVQYIGSSFWGKMSDRNWCRVPPQLWSSWCGVSWYRASELAAAEGTSILVPEIRVCPARFSDGFRWAICDMPGTHDGSHEEGESGRLWRSPIVMRLFSKLKQEKHADSTIPEPQPPTSQCSAEYNSAGVFHGNCEKIPHNGISYEHAILKMNDAPGSSCWGEGPGFLSEFCEGFFEGRLMMRPWGSLEKFVVCNLSREFLSRLSWYSKPPMKPQPGTNHQCKSEYHSSGLFHGRCEKPVGHNRTHVCIDSKYFPRSWTDSDETEILNFPQALEEMLRDPNARFVTVADAYTHGSVFWVEDKDDEASIVYCTKKSPTPTHADYRCLMRLSFRRAPSVVEPKKPEIKTKIEWSTINQRFVVSASVNGNPVLFFSKGQQYWKYLDELFLSMSAAITDHQKSNPNPPEPSP